MWNSLAAGKFQSPRGEGVVQTAKAVYDYVKEISKGFNHLAVRGWFRHQNFNIFVCSVQRFQSPRGEGVVQTWTAVRSVSLTLKFQSPRGEGVVQTANPQACMVMRQTRI